ncbi:MAG: MMPL family transporter [Gammaproteobacteria bacterium]|nr:MMPL family transporter [Gammaproteobacteria bacterium]
MTSSKNTPELLLERIIAATLSMALRFNYLVLLAAVLLTGFSVHYIVGHLGINTDFEDMLSEQLPWRQTQEELRRAFPMNTNTIAIVVDGQTPDQAQDVAAELAALLRPREDLFDDVFHLLEDPHFRHNQLLYLSSAELETLADQLATAQPFLARLNADPSLRGLFGLIGEAATTPGVDATPLTDTLTRISDTLDSVLSGEPRALSWQALMSDRPITAEDRRQIIVVNPRLDYSELLPGKVAVEAIRQIIDEHGFDARRGVNIRLTGSAAMGYEELVVVSAGSERAAILSLVMVAACLVFGLRSGSAIFATLTVLIMGLVLSAGFAAFAVGNLNMISLAFAVLYVGLAVAFAIHYVLRVRDLLVDHEKRVALINAAKHVGGSITLCAVTTALGFYSFLPTAYDGVAELGLIAGTSMLIGLVLSLVVLPALLSLLPLAPAAPGRRHPWIEAMAAFPQHHARAITMGALVLAVISLLLLPETDFDDNPLHLQDPTMESVITFRDLLEQSSRSPYTISLLTEDAGQAAAFKQALAAKPTVDGAMSIDDFVPADQPDKIAIIDDLAFTLGPDLEAGTTAEQADADAELAATGELAAALESANVSDPALSAAMARLSVQLRQVLEQSNNSDRATLMTSLHDAVLVNLPGRLERLRDSLAPSEFGINDLPDSLVRRWVAPDGRPRVEVLPREDLDDNSALARFVSDVRDVTGPAATDTPVVILEAGHAVVTAFQQAILTATLAIALVLWLVLRSVREVALALAPLLIAGLLTATATIVLNMPFNFANVIALPLLLGIGVDNGLHILHRYRTDLVHSSELLTTSTGRGVLLGSLTTACGFGNLATSPHLGIASLGMMLTVGLAIAVACSLIILPALLTLFPIRAERLED